MKIPLHIPNLLLAPLLKPRFLYLEVDLLNAFAWAHNLNTAKIWIKVIKQCACFLDYLLQARIVGYVLFQIRQKHSKVKAYN